MTTKLPQAITNKTYENQVGKWLEIVKNGESGCILFCPRTDRHRRINQLLNDVNFIKKHLELPKRYQFLTLDFDLFPIEDAKDLTDYITSELNKLFFAKKNADFQSWIKYFRQKKINLVLLFLNAEKLFQKVYRQIFLYLAGIVEKNSNVNTLLFFESDLTHPKVIKQFYRRTSILQNIIFYPLYLKQDIKQFLYYLGRKWDIRIPEKIVKLVVNECAGHFLLVKEAIRLYKRNGKLAKDFEDLPSLRMRLEWIYEGFSASEKSALRKITFKKKSFNSDEKYSLSYLREIGILTKNKKIAIPLLERFISKRKSQNTNLKLVNSQILLNNVPINSFFSKQEYRVLKGLLENQDNLLSRDDLAQLIWPKDTDKKYSDWAIDQLIKRLRKKLSKLYISSKSIKTLRGQGYLLNLE